MSVCAGGVGILVWGGKASKDVKLPITGKPATLPRFHLQALWEYVQRCDRSPQDVTAVCNVADDLSLL